MVVSSMGLNSIERSSAPTITLGVLRKVRFLIWFVQRLIWIDSDATTHISVFMQGFLSCRRLNDGERYIYIGNGKSVEVQLGLLDYY